MKSKKIVSLVAMTAMLAACSQDELVSIAGDAKVDLGNRPVIGNVALGLGDIQTRMELAAGSSLRFDWANGDQIGAAIVDLPVSDAVKGKDLSNEGGEDYSSLEWTYDEYLANAVKQKSGVDVTYEQAGLTAKDFYLTHDYISSNYPYEYKDGSFNTQANLVEGNYVFYAPYNAANLMRKPIKAVLPLEQDCSSTVMKDTKYKQQDAEVSSTVLDQFYKGTIEGFENAPVVLGYQFLAAPTDGSVIRPKVEMNQLYAFPMITVKNEFTGRLYGEANDATSTAVDAKGVTMTIDSIQIYHEDASANKIFYTALTKAGQIADELAKDGEWGGKRFTEGAPTADLLDANSFETAYLHHGATNAIKLDAANTALGNKANRVTCVIGEELENGEEYHFHAILPAADYGKDLKARVFVTIGEKQYVIAKADVAASTFVTSKWADFTFEDEVNGGQNCVLIRGEHYPQAEFQQDGNGTKSFAGNMMTLVLGEGTAAFELDDHAVAPVVDNGLKTNTDLVNYLVSNVQRGVSIAEIVALRGVEKANWKTYKDDDNGVAAAAGNLAFSANNTIIINAELVAALAQQVYVTGSETFTLATNLPVANDVKLSVSGDVYTYTTLGENPVSFAFTMTGVTMGNTATALVAGINEIGASDQTSAVTATLALAENAKDAVVVLAGATGNATTVTVNNGGAGINAIYVNANTKLIVSEKACNALIIANGGEIELQAGASLTNKNNEFGNVAITNNIAGTIEGNFVEGVTVAATYSASWPTAKIAATSRINVVTINLSTANANFQIEQAQMDIFSNLTEGVALTLGSNIKGITSDSNVVLTNLTALTAPSEINWTTTSNTGITVSHKGATINKVVASGNVTFVNTAE